jgi:hypothetical protein
MGKPQMLAVELENSRVERLHQPRVEAPTDFRLDERRSGIGERCGDVCDFDRIGAEAVDALL